MKYPVIDLHCDLLAYLADKESHTPEHPASNCSLPQLQAGSIALQTLAVFSETQKGSVSQAVKQLSCFQAMLKNYGDQVSPFSSELGKQSTSQVILALENGSGFLEEEEPLELFFQRFDAALSEHPFLYVSLTWNTENRFGGGNASAIGLKRDGEHILEYLSEKKVAIDLSHTSDALAYDILNTLLKKGLKVTPIASHSNFRSMMDVPRNLPDELAKEVFKQGGIIGVNFVRHFIGDAPEDFLKHFHHGLSLGGENQLCLGGDFFGGIPTPALDHLRPFFQESFQDASCYPQFLDLLETAFSKNTVEKIAFENAYQFIKRQQLMEGI